MSEFDYVANPGGVKATRQREAELRIEATTIQRQLEAVGLSATRGARAMTPGERQEFDRLLERRDALRDEVSQNATALAAAEAENEAIRRGEPTLTPDGQASQLAARRAGIRTPGTFEGAAPRRGESFASRLFGRDLSADLGGFDDPREPLRIVVSGQFDPRLKAATAANGGVDSEGGFLLPGAFTAEILEAISEASIVLPRARVVPMVTREAKIPVFDASDRSAGDLADTNLRWLSENPTDDATVDVPLVRSVNLLATPAAVFIRASNELLNDIGSRGESAYMQHMAATAADGLDYALLNGLGDGGKPLGVFASPALISLVREATNRVMFKDIVAMMSRLTPSSMAKAEFFAHPSCLSDLLQLKVEIGTAGTLYSPLNEANGRITLFSRPLNLTERMKPLGQAGDIALLDLSQYVVGLRQQATVEVSGHVAFLKNSSVLRLVLRVAGQPVPSGPYQPRNSAPTTSPFIALNA